LLHWDDTARRDNVTDTREDQEQLAASFEERRPRLRAVAYRMLGSFDEAEDALQDAWLRVSQAGTAEVQNLDGWLTTITSRVCLNQLRARARRREDSHGFQLPDPVLTRDTARQPEEVAMLGDSIGLALLVVLDTLAPAERLAFVLHDMFGVPFAEIGALVDRSPEAARQLASRARRRVGAAKIPVPEADLAEQRRAVDAFFQAAREGDLEALIAVLDPGVELAADWGPRRAGASGVVRGARAVAAQARGIPSAAVRPVLVNGSAGALVTIHGRPFAVMGFSVVGGRIVAIHALADPERVARLARSILGDEEATAAAD
jgi:RNA polymerase sigma-70 factor, ECF subfamily